MARIYATSCEKDGKNFFTVPKSLQRKVEAIIISDGYEILSDGTVVPAED
jgi:hypothetical protein